MIQQYFMCLLLCMLSMILVGCEQEKPHPKPKVGVSFGVGLASRWEKEQAFMVERAEQLGMEIEVRLNKTDKPKSQVEDCLEMIASGIDVLIYTPRNVRKVDEVIAYAKQHNVKIISYARAALGTTVDLYIGLDTYKIGQSMGQYLIEKAYHGDVIILKGDPNDFNSSMLYYGAMKYINPLIEKGDMRLVADAYVPDWSPDEAKIILTKALLANNKKVSAILTPNDKIAGACAEVLLELGITTPVVITGMDAELEALKRLVSGTQDCSVYLDLRTLAYSAVEEAYNFATKKKINVNSVFDNESPKKIDAYLISGKLVTKQNIDKLFVETGLYTQKEIYGE